jgi:hypothetical protein
MMMMMMMMVVVVVVRRRLMGWGAVSLVCVRRLRDEL